MARAIAGAGSACAGGVLVRCVVQCDFGDVDGAGSGFAACGLGGLDAGGLSGLVQHPRRDLPPGRTPGAGASGPASPSAVALI